MSVEYSEQTLGLFAAPAHVYITDSIYGFIGFAGDTDIGEYVHLYFDTIGTGIDTIITKASFSAMGSVMMIAAAEKLCRLIEGRSFQTGLEYCDPAVGLAYLLDAPKDRLHSVNFVCQAFYVAYGAASVLLSTKITSTLDDDGEQKWRNDSA